MHLVSSPTRTVFAGCTNKSKKQANNQTNKNKQYTFIAAVPAYCRLIASPLLAHISWKAVLIEEGRIWSGSCLPNFFSWVEKKYVHYKRPNRPTNKRKNEKMNKQRQRDWGTEGRGNVRKGEETRWRANGYMNGQTGNRRTNQGGETRNEETKDQEDWGKEGRRKERSIIGKEGIELLLNEEKKYYCSVRIGYPTSLNNLVS